MNRFNLKFWILGCCIFLSVPLRAMTRERVLEILERDYISYRSYAPAGSTDPRIENLYFAEYFMAQSAVVQAGALTTTDLGWLLQRLQQKGFRFSLTDYPLAKPQDTDHLFVAIYGGDSRVRDGARRHFLEMRNRERASFPIPTARITVRPTLTASTLPASLAPLESANAEGTVDLVLNQASGKLSRLTAALEILGQTPSGRELLSGFLPHLRRGEVRVIEFTEAAKNQSHSSTGVPAAAIIKPEFLAFNPDGSAQIAYTIAVDPNAELGTLVSHLAHEIGHFTDRDWKNQMAYYYMVQQQAKEALQRGQRGKADSLLSKLKELDKKMNASTEPVAFQKQVNVHAELSRLFPVAKDFFYAKHQRGQMIAPGVTAAFLTAAYDIRPAVDIVACETSTSLLNPDLQ